MRLTVEQDLGHDIGLRLSYIGSHGSDLETFVDLNQVPANTIGWSNAFPLYGPFQSWGYIQSVVNGAESNYNSMSAALTKRFANGLQFQSSYMWTRDLSSAGGYAPSGTAVEGGSISSDRFHLGRDYGNVAFDRRHRFLTTYLYELPFGKGKPFLGKGGVMNYIAGGWVANAVSVFQTGFPLQITQSTNFNSGFGYASQRPNATGVSPVTSGSLEARLNNYINPAAFSTAPQFTFGNISRTIDMRGPGQANWDMSVFKNFVIKETLKAQFRCEALNAFNTPLFYGPNVSFGSSSFGKITTQANFSRQLQLALRFSF